MRGEAQTAEFKRIGRGGKEVWIQASYTPIRDEFGAVFKVVKYATEITQHKLVSADHAGQVAAIKANQAVIEFTTAGFIVDANQLFCDAVGYRLEEIKGIHHRMFVDADERESVQYRDFWRALAAGQTQSGNFRRITSKGKDLWINATYTPIRNADDDVCKIFKLARDITAQKQTIAEITRTTGDISRKVEKGSQQVAKSGATLDEIVSSVKKVSDIVTDIMAATVEQNTGIDAINKTLQEMDASTQSNSAIAALFVTPQ